MLHGIFSAKKISKVGPEIYGGYVASILKPKKFNTYKADVSCIYLLIYSLCIFIFSLSVLWILNIETWIKNMFRKWQTRFVFYTHNNLKGQMANFCYAYKTQCKCCPLTFHLVGSFLLFCEFNFSHGTFEGRLIGLILFFVWWAGTSINYG